MTYIPPSSNAITLALESGYSAPGGGEISLRMGLSGPSIRAQARSSGVFKWAGPQDAVALIGGVSGALAVPRDQFATLLVGGGANTSFNNPDRTLQVTAISGAAFSGASLVGGLFTADGVSELEANRYTYWGVAGVAAVAFAGSREFGATLISVGRGSGSFKSARISAAALSTVATSEAILRGRPILLAGYQVRGEATAAWGAQALVPRSLSVQAAGTVGFSGRRVEAVPRLAEGRAAVKFVGGNPPPIAPRGMPVIYKSVKEVVYALA